MTRPTVTQALAWRPAALHHLADGWDAAARMVHARVSEVGPEAAHWSGSAANAARERMQAIVRDADEVARPCDGGGAVVPIAGQHGMRAAVLSRAIGDALDRLGNADADTARDIDAPFAATGDTAAVVAGWPTMTGEHIARQIAAMTPQQRAHLVDEAPSIVGNTDGVPWISSYRSFGRHPRSVSRGSTPCGR